MCNISEQTCPYTSLLNQYCMYIWSSTSLCVPNIAILDPLHQGRIKRHQVGGGKGVDICEIFFSLGEGGI